MCWKSSAGSLLRPTPKAKKCHSHDREWRLQHEARVFRKGTHFFHLENWVLAQGLLHGALTLAGLRGRGRRNTLRIELRHNDVALAGLPAAFEGYTLLHLSDLHLDLSEHHLSCLVERVRGLACDVCMLTGGYRFATAGPREPAVVALARLRAHRCDSARWPARSSTRASSALRRSRSTA